MVDPPKRPVILRFYLWRGLVKARKSSADTSRAILKNVALQYAEGAYDSFRNDLQLKLEADLKLELEHIGILFRRHILGYSGRRTSPTGTLKTVTKGAGAPQQPIATGLPAWAPRNAKYLSAKKNATGHIRWFDNKGWVSGGRDARYSSNVPRTGLGPDNPGLLGDTFTKDAWQGIFGPISVQFRRKRVTDSEAAGATLKGGGKTAMRITVGTVYVRALGKIEPYMLPGYASGRILASSTGNYGLMSVLADTDPALAYRLGTMNNGVYRPTLEPFLGFYLTKVIPFAVSRRLRTGSLTKSIIIK